MESRSPLYEAVYAGDRAAAVAAARDALSAGADVRALVEASLIPAMRQIGSDFESGEAFVPEMLVAARAMDAVMALLEPHLAASGVEPKGRVCIGTVRGDLHDIGKNLVAMMLRGAGYVVDDLGVDCGPEAYASAIDRGAQVVCLSALLTTTMPAMKDVIDHLRASAPGVPVIVGGAPITQQYADAIGARGYAETAAGAVAVVDRCLA